MLDLNTAQEIFDGMLMAGESRTGIIYGVFKPKGFFAGTVGNQIDPGYMTVTNMDRLLTVRTGSLGYFTGNNRTEVYDLSDAKKLKIHKTVFGQYAFEFVFSLTERMKRNAFRLRKGSQVRDTPIRRIILKRSFQFCHDMKRHNSINQPVKVRSCK